MNLMNCDFPLEGMENSGLENASDNAETSAIREADSVIQEGDVPGEREENSQQEGNRRRRRKSKDGETQATAEDGEPLSGVSENDGEPAAPEESDNPEAGTEPDTAVPQGEPGRVRQNLLLSSSGRAIRQQQDYGQGDLSVLSAARNRREVLTATLDGYEPDQSGMYQVFFMVGKVKVIIPWHEMGFVFDNNTPDPIELRLRLNSMLGAIIDYMVRGLDAENLLAVGSRHDAMIVRQARILNRRDADGNYLVNVGTHCMARVLEVGERYVRMEVFGFDLSLPINAISNLWVNDAREVVDIGREYPVEITRLTRDPENGGVTALRASMRGFMEEAPIEVVTGNTYTGTVCSISRTAYYVNVKGIPLDVRCPIRSNYEAGMMVGDYVRFYITGVYDGRAAGAITRIIKRPGV